MSLTKSACMLLLQHNFKDMPHSKTCHKDMPRRRSNKQNGPSAEWVQEQKNRKTETYIGLYGLFDKTINRIVKK